MAMVCGKRELPFQHSSDRGGRESALLVQSLWNIPKLHSCEREGEQVREERDGGRSEASLTIQSENFIFLKWESDEERGRKGERAEEGGGGQGTDLIFGQYLLIASITNQFPNPCLTKRVWIVRAQHDSGEGREFSPQGGKRLGETSPVSAHSINK
jgi:hypothetical protein